MCVGDHVSDIINQFSFRKKPLEGPIVQPEGNHYGLVITPGASIREFTVYVKQFFFEIYLFT